MRIRRPRSWLLAFGLLPCLPLGVAAAAATPPEYKTFDRDQRIDYTPDPEELLRIWMVYVGQGDGLLIQLPPKYNYDPNPGDEDDAPTERIDILIDGGATPTQEASRMTAFIERLYGDGTATIEHVVITHHDQDHVSGLTYLLANSEFTVESIYHNGLASYRRGARDFSVFPGRGQLVKTSSKVMAVRDPADRSLLREEDMIEDIDELIGAFGDDDLHFVYHQLAEAVVGHRERNGELSFDRVKAEDPFILERELERGREMVDSELAIDLIWPLDRTRYYGGWGETINGNSVTFRLEYGEFSLLFTGDHNKESEEALLEHIEATGRDGDLECDVLKVPHHASDDAYEPFFRRREGFRPVLSVASMGSAGFQSKVMAGAGAWQHPSTDVIRWLGGHHRVYHTFIHERRFRWDEITTEQDRDRRIELRHILIETDGDWFRIVEVELDAMDLNDPPTVRQTRRSNGTRWIRTTARDEE